MSTTNGTGNDFLQTELLSTPRALQSGEELYFLLRIYESQNRSAEAVQVLDSENTGLNSRIVNNDRSFMLAKVQYLGVSGLWKEGYSYVKGLLTVPEDEEGRKSLRERDDWKIWNLLIAAARSLPEDKE
jgi:N-terminal acetyltransferase B complex non-catalytic subunit